MGQDQQSNKRNQTLAHEWVGLIARWEACAPSNRDSDPAAKRIDDLIADRDVKIWASGTGWEQLNLAEQLLARFMNLSQLIIEFANLLELAKSRALPALAAHQGNLALFSATPVNESQARDAYVALLHDLQSNHVQQRFRRTLGNQASSKLFSYGLALGLIGTIMLALLFSKPDWSIFKSQGYVMLLVAVAGCIGAYFSRTMTFLGEIRSGTLSYGTFIATYVDRMMRLRLAYGLIGAVVFYLLLKSGIVAGSVFPKLNCLFAICDSKLDPPPCKDDGTLRLGSELAGLLVWSFIAGFSERLVPDTLIRVEGKAAEGN